MAAGRDLQSVTALGACLLITCIVDSYCTKPEQNESPPSVLLCESNPVGTQWILLISNYSGQSLDLEMNSPKESQFAWRVLRQRRVISLGRVQAPPAIIDTPAHYSLGPVSI